MAVMRLGTTVRTSMADAIGTLLDSGAGNGKIELYGNAMPATPQTAAGASPLATIVLQKPSTSAATAGVETILDPASITGAAAGTAAWARLSDSTGTHVIDVDVTATGGGGTLQFGTTTVSVGLNIDLGPVTVTVPQG